VPRSTSKSRQSFPRHIAAWFLAYPRGISRAALPSVQEHYILTILALAERGAVMTFVIPIAATRLEVPAIRGIAIAQQVARRRVPRECRGYLM
jgi:hypothetical protein